MKTEELETVKSVARDVRKWAESYASKHSDHFGQDLGGLCAIASRRIHKELKEKGISSILHLHEGPSYGHCFLTVGDYVVDVTATQFRVRGKVMILPKKLAKREFWTSHKQFDGPRQLLRYQAEIRWPVEQRLILK